ncbi:hypothetical protein PO883_31735 [Massilia sp. DJPM01]|uniref:hypothetical protein n=1 Tax=Massilia sp. DJPM01 TaxID=3024404 RepID=UPI00259DB363|nr:hypothetical protein [Massilia sp. DJPM01]MDM5181754.1 hypothetical protein [Massilia sp. DJPM01]
MEDKLAFFGFFAFLAVVFFASRLLSKLDDLINEIKAFRIQIQETFTPADHDGGHYGHPKATRQIVELILGELRNRR